MTEATHRGHLIRPLPEEGPGGWSVLVQIEVHAKGQVERIHYRDPLHTYGSRAEADAAAVEFGRQMIENFIAPAYGEGDLGAEGRG